MLLKACKRVSVFVLLPLGALLMGCNENSLETKTTSCENPAPLNGNEGPDSPGYIVHFKEGVVTLDEVNRLQSSYALEVWVVYDHLNGFAAGMNDDTREKLRCESSIASIHFNSVYTTQ